MKLSWQKTALMVAAAAMVGTGVTATMAQQAEDEGTVIKIGPEGSNDPLPNEVDPRPRLQRQFQPWLLPGDPQQLFRQSQPASPYYIGVMAAPVSDQLRAHVDLEDGVGLVVLQVSEGSPAEEAGLMQHDILVIADEQGLHELGDLVSVVDQHSGDELTQFTIDVIRHGQPETVWVTPAKRPESDQLVQPGFGGEGTPFGVDQRELLDRMLQGRGFGGQGLMDHLQGNVSVQVQKQEGQPDRIVIQRDGETWEIDSDDPESLNELPEDLRPMVEGMLNGQQFSIPQFEGGFGHHMSDDLRDRVQQMEEQMQQLRQQLLDNAEQQK